MTDTGTPLTDAAEKLYDQWKRAVTFSSSKSLRGAYKPGVSNPPPDGWDHARTLERRIQRLERVIADAPHMERCDFAATGKCVCWKSRAARREG